MVRVWFAATERVPICNGKNSYRQCSRQYVDGTSSCKQAHFFPTPYERIQRLLRMPVSFRVGLQAWCRHVAYMAWHGVKCICWDTLCERKGVQLTYVNLCAILHVSPAAAAQG